MKRHPKKGPDSAPASIGAGGCAGTFPLHPPGPPPVFCGRCGSRNTKCVDGPQVRAGTADGVARPVVPRHYKTTDGYGTPSVRRERPIAFGNRRFETSHSCNAPSMAEVWGVKRLLGDSLAPLRRGSAGKIAGSSRVPERARQMKFAAFRMLKLSLF